MLWEQTMREFAPSFFGRQDVPCPECRGDPEGHCALCQDTRWVLRSEALEYWSDLYQQNNCPDDRNEVCEQIEYEIEALRALPGENDAEVLDA